MEKEREERNADIAKDRAAGRPAIRIFLKKKNLMFTQPSFIQELYNWIPRLEDRVLIIKNDNLESQVFYFCRPRKNFLVGGEVGLYVLILSLVIWVTHTILGWISLVD